MNRRVKEGNFRRMNMTSRVKLGIEMNEQEIQEE